MRKSLHVKSIDELPEQVRPKVREALEYINGSAKVIEADVDAALRIIGGEKPKKSKFRNKRVELDGIKFDSKWEAQRYQELRNLEQLSLISALQVHHPFALHVTTPKGEQVRIAGYEADFVYVRQGRVVIEDAKSPATRRKEAYVLKRKMFEAEYDTPIVEVERSRPRLGAGQ